MDRFIGQHVSLGFSEGGRKAQRFSLLSDEEARRIGARHSLVVKGYALMPEAKLMQPLIAVIIATKDRCKDIEIHAFASLERSAFRDFVCVVWDASDDDKTERVVQGKVWNFQLKYFKAPRVGSSSQRNDAVEYVLQTYPSIRYVLFMMDKWGHADRLLKEMRSGK